MAISLFIFLIFHNFKLVPAAPTQNQPAAPSPSKCDVHMEYSKYLICVDAKEDAFGSVANLHSMERRCAFLKETQNDCYKDVLKCFNNEKEFSDFKKMQLHWYLKFKIGTDTFKDCPLYKNLIQTNYLETMAKTGECDYYQYKVMYIQVSTCLAEKFPILQTEVYDNPYLNETQENERICQRAEEFLKCSVTMQYCYLDPLFSDMQDYFLLMVERYVQNELGGLVGLKRTDKHGFCIGLPLDTYILCLHCNLTKLFHYQEKVSFPRDLSIIFNKEEKNATLNQTWALAVKNYFVGWSKVPSRRATRALLVP